jgi:hypothetical protein
MRRHNFVKYCEQEELERLASGPSFITFSGVSHEPPKRVSEMEQRDLELLDKQLRASGPSKRRANSFDGRCGASHWPVFGVRHST